MCCPFFDGVLRLKRPAGAALRLHDVAACLAVWAWVVGLPRMRRTFERYAVLLSIVLLPLLLGTLATFWLGSRSRLLTACAAGAVTAASLGLLLSMAPAVLAGQTVMNAWPWVPEIGLNLTFRLDGLSMMFAGLILFIGLMIILYAHSLVSGKF
jgi:hypothetical protein